VARIRTYKPEFFTDEKTGRLMPVGKCALLAMMSHADDEGLIRCTPEYIKSIAFPYNPITDEEVEAEIVRMEEASLIYRYTRNGQRYAWIVKFRKHQRIDKPQAPTNPPPNPKNKAYQKSIFRRDGHICSLCGAFTDEEDRTLFDEAAADYGGNFPVLFRVNGGGGGSPDYPSRLACACNSCVAKLKQKEQLSNGANAKRNRKSKNDVPFEEIIGNLNTLTGQNFSHSAPTHRDLILRRYGELTGSPKDKLAAFLHVNRVMTEAWKNDSKMKGNLRPATLYGDKFHDYLGKVISSPPGGQGTLEQHWRKGNWSMIVMYLRKWIEGSGATATIAPKIADCLEAYDSDGPDAFRKAWNESGLLLEGQKRGEKI
jgi:uncharacterized phage protein (TIGR02220 family)